VQKQPESNLKQQTQQDDDPSPDLGVMEVGQWSIEKHELLRRYVYASSGARKSKRPNGTSKWQHKTFIDLFCGPGRVRVTEQSRSSDGGAVAAWRESLRTKSSFTSIFIGDVSKEAVSSCETRLATLGASVNGFVGTAETTVDAIVPLLPAYGLHLVYLDPFNMGHLPFSIIEKFGKLQHVDIVLHFSVSDLQRNVELDFLADESRFDAFAPGWKEHVRVDKISKREAREEFTSYWLGLVNAIGFTYSKQQPLFSNSKNGPLYQMILLSKHPLPEKLWNDVAKPRTADLFDD
jgi:three-Cys-motif partner protein